MFGLGLLLSGVLLATESTTTYGIGLGQLYNGVGVNVASHDISSMKSIALGCMEIGYGSYSGLDASCGLSVAYVSTSILSDSPPTYSRNSLFRNYLNSIQKHTK